MMSHLRNAPFGKKTNFLIFSLTGFFTCGLVLVSCAPPALMMQTPVSTRSKGAATAPLLSTSTPIPNTTYNFEILITELEKTMPGAYTEDFIFPSASDRHTFYSLILSITDNTPPVPVKLASTLNYDLLMLFDQADSGAESCVLRERQPIEKGWGMYFFREKPWQDIVIEAPHPIADENTEEVSLGLYRALQAKALLIAGAHRDANIDGSADVAHAPDSIFQTAHLALFKPTGQPTKNTTIFLQIHGYASDRHPDTPQVVIGYNWMKDPEKDVLISNIINTLEHNGISAGVCNGKNYRGLCGTSNVQGLATDGGIFIHMELSETLRSDDHALIASLQQVLNP